MKEEKHKKLNLKNKLCTETSHQSNYLRVRKNFKYSTLRDHAKS